jgi:hypothetical protein
MDDTSLLGARLLGLLVCLMASSAGARVRHSHDAWLAPARDCGADVAARRLLDVSGLAVGAFGIVVVVRLVRDLLYGVLKGEKFGDILDTREAAAEVFEWK